MSKLFILFLAIIETSFVLSDLDDGMVALVIGGAILDENGHLKETDEVEIVGCNGTSNFTIEKFPSPIVGGGGIYIEHKAWKESFLPVIVCGGATEFSFDGKEMKVDLSDKCYKLTRNGTWSEGCHFIKPRFRPILIQRADLDDGNAYEVGVLGGQERELKNSSDPVSGLDNAIKGFHDTLKVSTGFDLLENGKKCDLGNGYWSRDSEIKTGAKEVGCAVIRINKAELVILMSNEGSGDRKKWVLKRCPRKDRKWNCDEENVTEIDPPLANLGKISACGKMDNNIFLETGQNIDLENGEAEQKMASPGLSPIIDFTPGLISIGSKYFAFGAVEGSSITNDVWGYIPNLNPDWVKTPFKLKRGKIYPTIIPVPEKDFCITL